jgi:RNA polymerase sigma factor (sigma-70 family)
MTAEPGQQAPTSLHRSDPELIGAVRAGDPDAYATLYTRHVDSARRLALALTGHESDADDLVAEGFAKLLSSLRAGGGPTVAFRAYLLTTVRNLFYDRLRRDRRLNLTDDLASHDTGIPFVDTAVERLERTMVARAFARLPQRWQTVLWHTEVEGETPATLAPRLALTPNGVSALAYRARARLRQNYFREHIGPHLPPPPGGPADRPPAPRRAALPARRRSGQLDQQVDPVRVRPGDPDLAADVPVATGATQDRPHRGPGVGAEPVHHPLVVDLTARKLQHHRGQHHRTLQAHTDHCGPGGRRPDRHPGLVEQVQQADVRDSERGQCRQRELGPAGDQR